MPLADNQILELCQSHDMIKPYVSEPMRYDEYFKGIVSYGPSAYGYDIRIGSKFKIFHNVFGPVIDPKNFNSRSFIDVSGEDGGFIDIPPNSFALGSSYEYIKMPREVIGICLGKSTYARCGIIVNVTPLEPEWEGYITMEISNTTPLSARIYCLEGIAQLVFFKGDAICSVSYKDKDGKYQGQLDLTLPKV